MRWEILEEIWLTCSDQDSNGSKVTPRYLKLSTFSMKSPLYMTLTLSNLSKMCLVPKTMNLFFLMFSVRWFSLNQEVIIERLSLSWDWSTDASLELHIRVVSSAYIIVLQFTQSGREFTNMINNNGPKIVPCGIPISIILKSESEQIPPRKKKSDLRFSSWTAKFQAPKTPRTDTILLIYPNIF